MKAKFLRVERLERRELLAVTVGCGPVVQPVPVQERVMLCDLVQEQTRLRDGACDFVGPIQDQVQLRQQLKDGSCQTDAADQTQTRDQLRLKDGSCQDDAADQTRDQLQDGTGIGPIQDRTRDQLKDGSCQTDDADQTQTRDQLRLRDASCIEDAAIASLFADDVDPLRARSGDTAHPENGVFVRDRDGQSW